MTHSKADSPQTRRHLKQSHGSAHASYFAAVGNLITALAVRRGIAYMSTFAVFESLCAAMAGDIAGKQHFRAVRLDRRPWLFDTLRTRHPSTPSKAGAILRSSRTAPHPGANRALRRLTSEVGKDPVRSARCGRQEVEVCFVLGFSVLYPLSLSLNALSLPGVTIDMKYGEQARVACVV